MPGEIREMGSQSTAGILHECRCVCVYVDFITKKFLINKSKNRLQGCWCDWQCVSVRDAELAAMKGDVIEDPVGHK